MNKKSFLYFVFIASLFSISCGAGKNNVESNNSEKRSPLMGRSETDEAVSMAVDSDMAKVAVGFLNNLVGGFQYQNGSSRMNTYPADLLAYNDVWSNGALGVLSPDGTPVTEPLYVGQTYYVKDSIEDISDDNPDKAFLQGMYFCEGGGFNELTNTIDSIALKVEPFTDKSLGRGLYKFTVCKNRIRNDLSCRFGEYGPPEMDWVTVEGEFETIFHVNYKKKMHQNGEYISQLGSETDLATNNPIRITLADGRVLELKLDMTLKARSYFTPFAGTATNTGWYYVLDSGKVTVNGVVVSLEDLKQWVTPELKFNQFFDDEDIWEAHEINDPYFKAICDDWNDLCRH